MKKQLLRIIFVLSILMSFMPIVHSATSPGFFDYKINSSGTGIIIKHIDENIRSVDIPAYIDGLPVVTIGSGGTLSRYITSVKLPNTVKYINDYAFYDSDLYSIEIPNSLISIGKGAFDECDNLQEITIPEDVTRIEDYAFERCKSLKTINFNAKNCTYASGVFGITAKETVINIGTEVQALPDAVFANISSKDINLNAKHCRFGYNSLGKSFSITIGEEVEYLDLGNYSCYFYDADYDERTQIPLSIDIYVSDINKWLSIEKQCFSSGNTYNLYINNELIKDLIIPDNITEIKMGDFAFCSITSVTIPQNVTNIGYNAFKECENLNKVNISDIASWCDISFNDPFANPLSYAKRLYINDEIITDIVIPDSVTDISAYAFYNCSGLTSITIPDSVTSIGKGAFSGCSGLTSVTIPDSVTSIGDEAFSGCSNLTSVTIPDSVANIGDDAFKDCNNLYKVNITDIASWCDIYFGNLYANPLYYAERLYINDELVTEITIPDGITNIHAYAFSGCSGLTSVTIPDNVTSIGSSAFSGCRRLTSVTIPDSVTSIGSSAFSGCSGLTSVTIPDNVTSIGSSAFSGCRRLTSVTIPDSVTSIGSSAFSGCSGLTSVTIPDNVTSIGSSAFSGCSSLKELYYNAQNCTSMGSSYYPALEYCTSLKEIYIGDNIKIIPQYAFYGCRGLTDIYWGDSLQKWNTIFSGSLSSSTVVHTIESINDVIVEEISSVFYNGEALMPEPVVRDDSIILTKDQDYNISYENNFVVGTAYLTITGTGQENLQTHARYTGNKTITFNIEKANPEFLTKPIGKADLIYDGTEQELLVPGEVTGGLIQYSFEENDNFSDNIPAATDAGIYTVFYKVVGDDNYNDSETQKITVSIRKADASVTVPTPKEDLVYNKSAQELINPGNSANGVMQYSFDENDNYSTDIPTAINAGNYTIYYKVVGDENHNDGEVNVITAKISKAESYIDVSPTTTNNIIYNGMRQELINPGNSANGVMQYSFDENDNYSTDIPTAINAGNYTIYYKVVGDENHNDGEVNVITAKISKAESCIDVSPTTNNIVYNGMQQNLMNPGTAIGGTIQYSINENSDFSENMITATNAGTYTVYYKIVGDDNHLDSAVKSLEITIEKASPDVKTPDALTAYIGQSLSEITLPTNWRWITPETHLTSIGSYTFEAEYIPADTNNYNSIVDNISVDVSERSIVKTETSTSYVFEINLKNEIENCHVYAAVYDANGVLLTVNRVPLEMTETTSISVNKSADDALAKIFVWTDTLQPIAEKAREFSLTN